MINDEYSKNTIKMSVYVTLSSIFGTIFSKIHQNPKNFKIEIEASSIEWNRPNHLIPKINILSIERAYYSAYR